MPDESHTLTQEIKPLTVLEKNRGKYLSGKNTENGFLNMYKHKYKRKY